MACAAPFLCLLNRGSICCPRFSSFKCCPVSFSFEHGQCVLPPFQMGQHLLPCFFSFQTGAACAAPVSLRFQQGQYLLPPFLSVSIGSSMWDTCCSHSFPFQMGAACGIHTAPLFLSVSTGGSMKLKCGPRFLSFTPQ